MEKGGIQLEELEQLRSLLYKAIDSNKKEEILKVSKKIDKVIVKDMRALYLDKKSCKEKSPCR